MKRKKEFIWGRYSIRQAILNLNEEPFPVLVGKNREPLWNEKIIGSLSHTDSFVISIVGYKTDYQSLGIDIENTQTMEIDLLPSILTDYELKKISIYSEKDKLLKTTQIFSIKEAFYKYQFPISQCYVDFLDAVVEKDNYNSQVFYLQVINPPNDLEFWKKTFVLYSELWENHVISYIF